MNLSLTPLWRWSCGASSPCLSGLQRRSFWAGQLSPRSFSELPSFPSWFGLRRVLRRRGVCGENGCWSCQPQLGSSVATRAESTRFWGWSRAVSRTFTLGWRLLSLFLRCRFGGSVAALGAPSPNKARYSPGRCP